MQQVHVYKGFLSDGTLVENLVLPCTTSITSKWGPYNTRFMGVFDSREVKQCPKNRINLRIMFVNKQDYKLLEKTSNSSEQVIIPTPVIKPSPEEIESNIKEKFDVLSLITSAVAENQIRSLVVSGTPGTGKSFGIQKIMDQKTLKDQNFYYTVIKGSITPICLYLQLYECRNKNSVLILDDCDIVVEEIESLNMLKAATDSSKTRIISYSKMNQYLEENEIPKSFEFEGGIIYLSNINFENELQRKTKVSPHIAAFISRSHYIDVNLNSLEEKLIRILMVAQTEEFTQEHKVTTHQVNQACMWIKTNCQKVRELSIRLVVKVLDLIKTFSSNWERVAKVTLCG